MLCVIRANVVEICGRTLADAHGKAGAIANECLALNSAHSTLPPFTPMLTPLFRRPPRPPVVKSEWCEQPQAYASRLIDQLLDHIVQVGTLGARGR